MNEHIINQEINGDFLLKQFALRISEMEKNSKIFERLNKKFIAFQQE